MGKHRGTYDREATQGKTVWDVLKPIDFDFFQLGVLLNKTDGGLMKKTMLDYLWGPDRSGPVRGIYGALEMVKAWIDSYDQAGTPGFQRFSEEWKYARLYVDLQTRLFVEQILWDRGVPWRYLCTGFKSVDVAGSRAERPRVDPAQRERGAYRP